MVNKNRPEGATRSRSPGPSKDAIFHIFDKLLVSARAQPVDKSHGSFLSFNIHLISAYNAWVDEYPVTGSSFPMSLDRLCFIALLWWRHIVQGQLLPTDHPAVQPLKQLLLNSNRIRQDGRSKREDRKE